MTDVTRFSCWHQNYVSKGLSAPALGLYTCIKSWKKKEHKIRLQGFFGNLQQMTEVTRGFCWHQNLVLGIPVMRYERAARPCALNFRLAALKCRFGRPPNALSSVGVWPSMPPLCASFIQNVITLTRHLFIGKKCGVFKHSYLSINLKLFR